MKLNQNFVARDVKTGEIIASRVTMATTRKERAIGLLGRTHLDPGEALWIAPCHGVHTCFMRFAIDIIAMNKDGVVVDAVGTLKPWRFRLPKDGACIVLELPAGTLKDAPAMIGHRIKLDGWSSAFAPSAHCGESLEPAG